MFDLIPSTEIELLQLRMDDEKVTRLFLNISDVLWWQWRWWRWWWWRWWSWRWWWCRASLVIIIVILFLLLITTFSLSLSLIRLLRLGWLLWTLEQTSEQRSRRRCLPGRCLACYNNCISFLTRSSATAELAWVGGHYAVQGHSRSLNLVPIESPYATY